MDPTLTPEDIVALDALALREHLANGTLTAEDVVVAFLERIAAIDSSGPMLNALIELNPDALARARSLDQAFRESGSTGPLHGLPVVLKANIDTADRMATSAGSMALADHHAAADAPLVTRLRDAGAVIIAKANLSEWANFRSARPTSGWSSLGGQTHNPYVLDRNPCGSSSGSAVAVAARLAPLAIGTETDGSIVCPAGQTGIVGIKPTLGLISQQGIIPIAASQDTAGPMATTVAGAALLLAAMVDQPDTEYLLDRVDLAGLRLGVVRDFFGADRVPEVEAQYQAWIGQLAEAGAELIDPIALERSEEADAQGLTVLLYEFKAGLNQYLADAGSRYGSLDALIEFNAAQADSVMPIFGQELFIQANAKAGLDAPEYLNAVARSAGDLRARLESLFEEQRLDALIAPANAPAWKTDWLYGDRFILGSSSIAAVSGYPSIVVPAGLVSELPIGLAFIARPNQEDLLLNIAAVFEQSRGAFPAPRFVPTLEAAP